MVFVPTVRILELNDCVPKNPQEFVNDMTSPGVTFMVTDSAKEQLKTLLIVAADAAGLRNGAESKDKINVPTRKSADTGRDFCNIFIPKI